jgi:hypothetical protein
MDSQELIRYNSLTAIIQLPKHDYVNWMLKRSCFEELWELFRDCDDPAKEISESYSAYHQLKKICRLDNLKWLHIGDGSRARTAALFTFLTKSENISIDPNIRQDILMKWQDKWQVKRMYYLDERFEDSKIHIDNHSITCVHAHVNLEEVDKKFPNWKYLYSSICCYPNKQKFSKEYMEDNWIIEIVNKLDMNILSERREFVIYKKIN